MNTILSQNGGESLPEIQRIAVNCLYENAYPYIPSFPETVECPETAWDSRGIGHSITCTGRSDDPSARVEILWMSLSNSFGAYIDIKIDPQSSTLIADFTKVKNGSQVTSLPGIYAPSFEVISDDDVRINFRISPPNGFYWNSGRTDASSKQVSLKLDAMSTVYFSLKNSNYRYFGVSSSESDLKWSRMNLKCNILN